MQFQEYLKGLEDWAKEQSPVFIVGPERSGTSLLFQQVSNHPDFCDFSNATVETFCFVKPWQIISPPNPENYEMRVYLGLGAQLKSLQQQLNPLVEKNLVLSNGGLAKEYLNTNSRNKIWSEREYKHILRAFFYASWHHLGQKRLVEKTPAHIRCVKEILETFPKAKILVCTRDVTEIIASHKKRFLKEIEMGKNESDPSLAWLNKTPTEYLTYLDWVKKLINQAKKQWEDNVLIVPYGDLTHQSSITLRKVFDFLGAESFQHEGVVKDRKDQIWDPLLNKQPQPNEVDVERYIDSVDLKLILSKKDQFDNFWR